MVLSETEPLKMQNIYFLIVYNFVYFGMIISNLWSMVATGKLIKNKPLSMFDKVLLVGLLFAIVFFVGFFCIYNK